MHVILDYFLIPAMKQNIKNTWIFCNHLVYVHPLFPLSG